MHRNNAITLHSPLSTLHFPADGAGGRTVPPGGRDEGETGDPRAKTCHARAISPPPAGRTASGRARIWQDVPPTAYMHTPSGAADAEAASPGAGVPLQRNRPHADKALNTNEHPHANGIAQRLGMLRQHKKIMGNSQGKRRQQGPISRRWPSPRALCRGTRCRDRGRRRRTRHGPRSREARASCQGGRLRPRRKS